MPSTEGTFIRGLWGPPQNDGLHRRWHTKTQNDVRRSLAWGHQLPFQAYAAGADSGALLRGHGFDPVELPPDPLVAAGRATHWREKLHLIDAALLHHGEVVWLDWDTLPNTALPTDFWAVLRDGAPLRAKLVQYRRIKAPWRSEQPRCSVSAAFIYARERAPLLAALQATAINPDWTEEMALMHALDGLAGGWCGHQAYLDSGCDVPFYTSRNAIFPDARSVFAPEFWRKLHR